MSDGSFSGEDDTVGQALCERCGRLYNLSGLWNGICWACECDDDQARGLII
jgi:hypothetical protein